jgi:hypothetical protein
MRQTFLAVMEDLRFWRRIALELTARERPQSKSSQDVPFKALTHREKGDAGLWRSPCSHPTVFEEQHK